MALATLPLVLSVVLLELAVGGAFLIWFLDRTGQAPSGFLKLTAGVNAVAGALALGLSPSLPDAELARRAALDSGAIRAFAQGLPVVVVLLLAQMLVSFLPWRALRLIVGAVVLVAGGLVLVAAAVARPSDAPFDVFALAALPLGALALGGSTAAMLLGHWYLVTPKLSTDPLRRATLVVIAAVILQIGLVAVTVVRGDFVGVLDPYVVPVTLRVGVGLLMTLAVLLAAWWTARMNTQSSTGLLYVAVGTVIAGEISARVVFFLTGIPL